MNTGHFSPLQTPRAGQTWWLEIILAVDKIILCSLEESVRSSIRPTWYIYSTLASGCVCFHIKEPADDKRKQLSSQVDPQATWRFPKYITENQIDHICMCQQFCWSWQHVPYFKLPTSRHTTIMFVMTGTLRLKKHSTTVHAHTRYTTWECSTTMS